jgi:hypothetical protein
VVVCVPFRVDALISPVPQPEPGLDGVQQRGLPDAGVADDDRAPVGEHLADRADPPVLERAHEEHRVAEPPVELHERLDLGLVGQQIQLVEHEERLQPLPLRDDQQTVDQTGPERRPSHRGHDEQAIDVRGDDLLPAARVRGRPRDLRSALPHRLDDALAVAGALDLHAVAGGEGSLLAARPGVDPAANPAEDLLAAEIHPAHLRVDAGDGSPLHDRTITSPTPDGERRPGARQEPAQTRSRPRRFAA